MNWNNRPQGGFETADDHWSLGAVQRVDLLLRNLGPGRGVTPAKVVATMNAAATQDVREHHCHGGCAAHERGGTPTGRR